MIIQGDLEFAIIVDIAMFILLAGFAVLELNGEAVGYELNEIGDSQLIEIAVDGRVVSYSLLFVLTLTLLQQDAMLQ